MAPRFIHLHNHSEYSILDGAIRVKKLPKAAVKHGMGAVALTDHGNMFGAVAFYKAAKKAGVKPILGSEVYVAPRSRFDKEARDQGGGHNHLLLLVQDETGYRNLAYLLSKAYTEGFYYRPRVDKALLAEHAKGLIALSGCLKGEIASHLTHNNDEGAVKAAGEYADIFGRDGFYIELMDHGLAPQKEVNPKLVRLARSLGLPLAVTNDCHYAEKDDAESHDALLCIQTNKKISDTDRIRFGSQEFYFKSAEEMAALFSELPEALEATYEIASRCDFSFPKDIHFLPHFEPPNGQSLQDYFESVSRQGFEARLAAVRPRIQGGLTGHTETEYRERFERELRLIEQMGFEGYFLIVWDLLRTARAKDIPVGPGRGSAAGSLLAFSLGITDIDPIEYDLLFERFLNPERISLPDIDMDFCARRREEMLRYVRERYGQDNVCQIITFGTMAARAAIRDVGRVLEVPLSEVDKIAKMIPFAPGQEVTIESALKDVPALREQRDRNSKIAHLLALAQKVEGQVRNPSIHAAGVVITPKPLTEFVPLYQSAKGEVTTQFAMKDVESIGLLKMDLLGLRNLTIIRDALDIIERDTGERPDVDNLPLDDAATFALFQTAATDGVFQFESPGMKNLLRRYRPEEFRDLIALNALFRPGPLKSGMTDKFVARKHDPTQIVYDIPSLEPILKETRGLIVYQEQVMRIAVVLAGFSMAQADVLRKAMGKKDKDLMKQQKAQFLAGVKAARIVPAGPAGKLFDQILEFAEYCFNKSHSAAYAALAFQTAWLKAHYPRHFMAALISAEAERGATAQVVKYINECKAMGIDVLPPDLNASDFSFAVRGTQIRFGLSAVKNVGETAARALVELRRERGAFTSVFDVVRDADTRIVTRRVLESLIKAGAFDSLGLRRAQSFRSGGRHDPAQPRGPAVQGLAPDLALRGRSARARDLGRGPLAARVGRGAAAVLREGGPGLLHHRPPAGRVRVDPAPAGDPFRGRAGRGARLRGRGGPGRDHPGLQEPQDQEGGADGLLQPGGPDRAGRGGGLPGRLQEALRPHPRGPQGLAQGQVHRRGRDPQGPADRHHAAGRRPAEAGQAGRPARLPAGLGAGHPGRAHDHPGQERGGVPAGLRAGDAAVAPGHDPVARLQGLDPHPGRHQSPGNPPRRRHRDRGILRGPVFDMRISPHILGSSWLHRSPLRVSEMSM